MRLWVGNAFILKPFISLFFGIQIKFSEFVTRHIGEMEGVILEAGTGDFLGKHQGFWFCTIGQHQGLRLPWGPWYALSLFISGILSSVLCLDYWFLHHLLSGPQRFFMLLSYVVFSLRCSSLVHLVYLGRRTQFSCFNEFTYQIIIKMPAIVSVIGS